MKQAFLPTFYRQEADTHWPDVIDHPFSLSRHLPIAAAACQRQILSMSRRKSHPTASPQCRFDSKRKETDRARLNAVSAKSPTTRIQAVKDDISNSGVCAVYLDDVY